MEPEIKGRITGVKSQINAFNYFYGVIILQLVLRHSDTVLFKTLKKSSLTSCQGKEIADLTLQTINSLQSKSKFEILLQKNGTTRSGIRNTSVISSTQTKTTS